MEVKPDYVVKNIHTGKVYDVFKASKSLTSLIGDFHLHNTNIIVLGLFLLCDIEFIEKPRCPTCAEFVNSIFDHVDTDCKHE